MSNDVIDFLIENRVELRRIIHPRIQNTLKNKQLFLPFELEDRIKESVNSELSEHLVATFRMSKEDALVLLNEDNIQNALEQLYYDPKEYS